jgi:hypothetical protein
VRQKFPRPREINISKAVERELSRPEIAAFIQPGKKVALAVGSRGLNGLTEIVQNVVRILKSQNCEPFIVPAMASHGGATAEGQEAILASYGITKENVGAPVYSSMEVTELGQISSEMPVYFDRLALSADLIIPINRVKPHTSFHGPIESGLLKMLCIGLGKHIGATVFHHRGMENFVSLLPEAGQLILAKAPVAFGLATIENAFGELALLRAVPKSRMIEEEIELLKKARTLMGQILFKRIDLLIVDEIGKDISGEGMDPNVTRRFSSPLISVPDEPCRIVVLDLTAKTKGNAIGLGLADITTERVWLKIDLQATYTNTITTTYLNLAKIPLMASSDQEAIQIALSSIPGCCLPEEARVVRIKNTKDLEEIFISQALKNEALENPAIEVLSEALDPEFDKNGNFLSGI